MKNEVKLIISNKGMEALILEKFGKIMFADSGYDVTDIKNVSYKDQWEITLEEKGEVSDE